MKKNFFLMVVLSLTIATTSFAQVSATPEVPKNYKPQPKELLPMPGELTDEMIFPVLGKYEYENKEGEVASVTITRDAENKGVVWINGMPQGKFKADLRQSPSTYKIPVQKTLQNDVDEATATEATDAATEKSETRYSGKSIKEGTLIFDSTSNKLYVNVGAKFDEENPAAIFPEMMITDDSSATIVAEDETNATEATNKKTEKKDKKKVALAKGTNYVLTKVVEVAAAPVNTQQ